MFFYGGMLDGRRLKDRKSSGQFEARANIDRSRHRNTGSRSPNRLGLAKVNTATRIPIKIDTPSSAAPPVPTQPLSVPLSSSISSSSVSSPLTTTELAPEIYFLIREHAKTLTAINKITNRLEKLEHKVEDICKKVKQIDKFNETRGMGSGGGGIKKGESSSGVVSSSNNNPTTTPNALSDDSGVEYSRTTTGTGHDDDELLCLLNQITKFSDSIKQTLTQPNSNIHSPLNPRTGHPMVPGENGSMVYGLAGSTSSSTASSTLRQSVNSTSNNNNNNINININSTSKGIRHPHIHPPPTTRKTISSPMDQSRMADCPEPASAPQSFSALLFESNVDHFLANLDFMPEPVRASDYYYPPSIPITSPPPPPHHHLNLNHHLQHVKSHPVPASHLLTETLHHQHEQPEQQ